MQLTTHMTLKSLDKQTPEPRLHTKFFESMYGRIARDLLDRAGYL